jgi:hypothetical protein
MTLRLPGSASLKIALYQFSRENAWWVTPQFASKSELQPACLPIENDFNPHSGLQPQVMGWLELYGGPGLGGNAGGVRCANVNDVQIKGIGATRLAGPGTDKWHRHGALSLQDAIKESIAAGLFDAASPYGAVKSLAAVDLGLRFATEVGEAKLPSSAPRALLFREQSIRMGHFMRSSFMNVGPELAQQELMRMRAGIPVLVDHLLAGSAEPVSFESASRGLAQVYDTLMHQIAVLRTKRLVHGSLIPSNYTIDGRLLDFTTATAVSTLQPVMVSLGGTTSQQQHHQILESLPDMLFYIAKYDRRCAAPRGVQHSMAEQLLAYARRAHHDYLMEEHLQLFGFSAAEVGHLSLGTKSALAAALLGLIAQGSINGHLYFGGDEHPMLAQAGRDDVFAALVQAIALHAGLVVPNTGNYSPRPLAFSARAVEAAVESYAAAAEELEMGAACKQETGLCRLVRAMQRNADLSELYRRNLDGEINDVCEARGDFAAFIDAKLDRWRGVFHAPLDGTVDLGGWLTEKAVALRSDGSLCVAGESHSVRVLASLLSACKARPRHMWLMDVARANFGDHVDLEGH